MEGVDGLCSYVIFLCEKVSVPGDLWNHQNLFRTFSLYGLQSK